MATGPHLGVASAVLAAHFGDSPFLLRDAEPLLSRRVLRTAMSHGLVVRLRRGVAVLAGEWEQDARARHLLLARAAQLTLASAVASHWTAVLTHALPVPTRADAVPPRPTLTLPRGGGEVDGLRLVAGSLAPVDVVEVDGLVVTAPARTAVDVAAERPLTHALVVLDAVARRLLAEVAPGLDPVASAAD